MKNKVILAFCILISLVIFWIGCRRNNPPDEPSVIHYPTGDYHAFVVYDFIVQSYDSEGDFISYQFDWGEEDTSDWSEFFTSGAEVTFSKSWAYGGTYSIRVRARDEKNKLSQWSTGININITGNQPPNLPLVMTSSSRCWAGDTFTIALVATDPDNDSIALRYSWNNGSWSDWSSYVGSGTIIVEPQTFDEADEFFVKAQAKDKHGAYSQESKVDSILITKLNWICANQSPEWISRSRHTGVVFDNKIWILGGSTTTCVNDVWYSTDGITWTCATPSAEWSPRSRHTTIVFDNKMWVLGGWHFDPINENLNDIWYSSDGTNWFCATPSADWSPRKDHSSVIFQNKIWVIGGAQEGDVWNSTDGVNWVCVTNSPEWISRQLHASVVFDDKIWLIGGFYPPTSMDKDDVWYSSDGINWTCATTCAVWPTRATFCGSSVVFDNKIWFLIDGYDNVWYSNNGVIWKREFASHGWTNMTSHPALIFDNKLWVLGGDIGNQGCDDVWYTEIPNENEK